MTTLLLAAAFLSLCLSGAFAETATETEEAYAVLQGLLKTLEENPPANQVFEDAEAAAEYYAELYGYIDPAKVSGVFYGGQEEAGAFLVTLHDTLLPAERKGPDIISASLLTPFPLMHIMPKVEI